MLLVMITYEGQWTTGVLPVRRERTERVLKVLRAHLGHPLAEVAEVDVPEA